MPDSLEIRCTCRRRPLLAIAGRDQESGNAFIHVRTVKNKEVHTDVVVTSGTVQLHCRECFRWQKVTIRHTSVDIKTEDLPSSVIL